MKNKKSDKITEHIHEWKSTSNISRQLIDGYKPILVTNEICDCGVFREKIYKKLIE